MRTALPRREVFSTARSLSTLSTAQGEVIEPPAAQPTPRAPDAGSVTGSTNRHTGRVLHRHPFLSLLTGSYLVFVGWLTLTPQPIGPGQEQLILRVLDALHRRGYAGSIDYAHLEFLANIALFVPIGMFLLLLFGAGQWWLAAIGSFALTAFIETLQHQIPGRVPDERDLVANTLGGLFGIAVALVLTMRATIRRRRHRRQRKELQRSSVP